MLSRTARTRIDLTFQPNKARENAFRLLCDVNRSLKMGLSKEDLGGSFKANFMPGIDCGDGLKGDFKRTEVFRGLICCIKILRDWFMLRHKKRR